MLLTSAVFLQLKAVPAHSPVRLEDIASPSDLDLPVAEDQIVLVIGLSFVYAGSEGEEPAGDIAKEGLRVLPRNVVRLGIEAKMSEGANYLIILQLRQEKNVLPIVNAGVKIHLLLLRKLVNLEALGQV
jgi:hypothetical protein